MSTPCPFCGKYTNIIEDGEVSLRLLLQLFSRGFKEKNRSGTGRPPTSIIMDFEVITSLAEKTEDQTIGNETSCRRTDSDLGRKN